VLHDIYLIVCELLFNMNFHETSLGFVKEQAFWHTDTELTALE